MQLVNSVQKGEFRAGGVRFDNREGIGSVPNVANVAYMGAVALMTPATFLSLAPSLTAETMRETTHFLADQRDPCLGTPFLIIDVGAEGAKECPRIEGHEGRHRMLWIAEKFGDDVEIPVALFFRESGYSLRSRELTEEMFERLNAGAFKEKTSRFISGPFFSRISWAQRSEDLLFAGQKAVLAAKRNQSIGTNELTGESGAIMDKKEEYVEAVVRYVDHLREVWLQPSAVPKIIDAGIASEYEAAAQAMETGENDLIDKLIDTGSYLVDRYTHLVNKRPVRDLAEAEAGFEYYRKKLEASPQSQMSPMI